MYYNRLGDRSNIPGKKTSREDLLFYSRDIAAQIEEALCIPRDKKLNPSFAIGQSPLFPILSETDDEMYDFLWGHKGVPLEISLGEGYDLLYTKGDIQELSRKIDSLQIQEDEKISEDYAQLKTLLKPCLESPDLMLLFTMF